MSDLVERLRANNPDRPTIDRFKAADRIEALEKECFALAANQCHAGYGDEYGNHRCARIEALETALRNLIHDIDMSNTPTSVNRARAALDKAKTGR